MDGPAYIYALIDPRNGECRYIGNTVNGKNGARLRGHILSAMSFGKHRYGGNNPKVHAWIREVMASGMQPEFRILEETSYERGPYRERYWIVEMTRRGEKLLNRSLSLFAATVLKLESALGSQAPDFGTMTGTSDQILQTLRKMLYASGGRANRRRLYSHGNSNTP